MSPTTKKWLKFTIRWSIAIVGIWYVLANINLYDRVMIVDPASHEPVWLRVLDQADNHDSSFQVLQPDGTVTTINHDQIWTPADRKKVTLADSGASVALLAVRPQQPDKAGIPPSALLIRLSSETKPRIIEPDQLNEKYLIQVPYPLVDAGIIRRLHEANPQLLWACILVFPVTFLITSIRWQYLMRPLGISMTLLRALVLNMVGMFYSTFMPGSTGGDLVKAYYASKHTTNRTAAIMSVIVDRVIGLLALILLGGSMATVQYFMAASMNDPIAQSSLKVALLCGAILLATTIGLILFFNATTRRYLGLDFLLRKLPMQSQVQRAIEAMSIYRRHKWLVLACLIGTLPVHAVVVVSAMLAGMAFDLPLPLPYYFVAVPVIVLVGSIPISPQGAGVMEFFAIRLTERHGATIAQAFILTMAIRLVQMAWNLVGGIFVLKGGFQAPTVSQTQQLQAPVASDPSAPQTP